MASNETINAVRRRSTTSSPREGIAILNARACRQDRGKKKTAMVSVFYSTPRVKPVRSLPSRYCWKLLACGAGRTERHTFNSLPPDVERRPTRGLQDRLYLPLGERCTHTCAKSIQHCSAQPESAEMSDILSVYVPYYVFNNNRLIFDATSALSESSMQPAADN